MKRSGALCGLILGAVVLAGCQTGSNGSGAFAEIPGIPGSGTVSSTASAPDPGQGALQTSALATPRRGDILSIGDSIKVIFSDIPLVQPPFEETVKTDGSITLLQNQTFSAAGKTRGDLEKEIRERYVPSIFKNLTVTIVPQERFYFVDGEVKIPNRQIYLSRMTVLKAIASCGGFTDFASKTSVKLIRADGTIHKVNCKKALNNPKLDLEVFPGDTVHVPRSIW